MLKTFSVSEDYEPIILPFLQSKKNQSSYICKLILNDMKHSSLDEQSQAMADAILTALQPQLAQIQQQCDALAQKVDKSHTETVQELKVSEARIPFLVRDMLSD